MTNTSYERNIIKQAYKEKSVLLHVIESIQNEKIFTDPVCVMLWKIFVSVYKEGFNVQYSVIMDIIRFSGDENMEAEFIKIVESEYPNEEEWKYHLYVLLENYKKSLLNDISETIKASIDNSSSEEILNEISDDIIELQTTEIKTIPITNACSATFEEIEDINEGRKVSFLKTGNKKFDELVSISKGKFIMVSAGAKIGKTRFIVDLIKRLISMNEHIHVQWDTFEMKPSELVKCFISRQTKFTTYKLDGKEGRLQKEEMEQIKTASNYISKYPIEFIGEHLSIDAICAKFIKFCKFHKNETCVLVIDNLAYIKMETKDQVQFEDSVAKSLVELRDKTNGIIILLHHLTKEVDSKWNKDTGYEPKLGMIRGSKRLVDCPNQIILLHRPDFYPDLVKEQPSCVGLFLALLEVNRDGKSGIIKYRHNIDFSTFEEIE